MKALSVALLGFSLVMIGRAQALDAQERKPPVPELKRGGYLILIRHGETDRNLLPREQRKPEPSPMDLANFVGRVRPKGWLAANVKGPSLES